MTDLAQNGREVKLTAGRTQEFMDSLAARIRALCACNLAGLSAVVLALLVTARAAEQEQIRTQLPNAPAIMLGCAWYPEQWPEGRWERDLALMEAAGLHLIRVGEFAWSRMEPSEGHYDLDWLDRAIAKAARYHLVTVLGTPTDAPPAWLTQKYPDTVRIDPDGRPVPHGNRRQFSYSSPHFREFARRIAEQLAIRFGKNPNVVGWQIGNEYTDESFDPETRRQFQQWLRAKYKTLDALNAHWTTSYWSQTYDRWDEIPMLDSHGNPGLLLDYRRFVTDTWRSFQRVQLDAIRAHADPRQFITTNFGGLGWTDKFDHYVVARDLDLASWDDYVGEGHLNRDRDSFTHDLVRGLKRQNFWVMETQPGYVNWAPINNSLDRGETRMMAWEAIGHGADCISYWQWRSALNGQEQYHGVLVGPDGEPVPVYSEIQQVGKEFAKAQQIFRGTSPQLLKTKPSGILFDALDDKHLRNISELVWELRLPFVIGSSGFTSGMAAYLSQSGRSETYRSQMPVKAAQLVVISGSGSPVTERRIRWALANGFSGMRLPVRALTESSESPRTRASVLAEALGHLQRGQNLVLYSALGPSDCEGTDARHELGTQMGILLREILQQSRVKRALIAGGDTSSHAGQQLGIYALTMISALAPGAPLCRAHSDHKAFSGLELVLKGGQVGAEDFFGSVLLGRV